MIAPDGRGPDCIDTNTLAAFIEDRLTPAERATVEQHAAACEDCYEALVGASELDASQKNKVDPVPKPRARTPLWFGLAAAAAIVGALWIRPFGIAFTTSQRVDDAIEQLESASTPARPAYGRVAGQFRWAPAPGPDRGPSAIVAPSADVRGAAAVLERLALAGDSARVLSAVGISRLMEGRTDAAIEALERAVAIDANDVDAHTSLSAALLEKWRAERTEPTAAALAERALNEAVLAVRLKPDAAPAQFNRAMALEALGLRQEAIAAWEAIERTEKDKEWKQEATRHLNDLRRAIGG